MRRRRRHEAPAERRELRIRRERQTERPFRQVRDLVQQEPHDQSGAPFELAALRQLLRFDDQAVHEPGDADDAQALRQAGNGVRRDIDRAHRDIAQHLDRMLDAGRYPHGMVGRHHPAAVLGRHQHDADQRVQQLAAAVPVPRHVVAVGIFGRQRDRRPDRLFQPLPAAFMQPAELGGVAPEYFPAMRHRMWPTCETIGPNHERSRHSSRL